MVITELFEAYMDDQWHKDANSIKWGPVPRGVLAKFTDKDGYTSVITGRQPHEYDPLPRYGQQWIIAPNGEKTKAGYWMNWPEPEWNISPLEWGKMSWKDRAAMEVKQQATAYDSLKNRFLFHKRNPSNNNDATYKIIYKWDTGQMLSHKEAAIMKTMLRNEIHPEIDKRTKSS